MYPKRKYILLFVVSLLLCGCMGRGNQGASSANVQEQLIAMKSYACVVEVTHLENDQENTYTAKQIYEMSGRYRMEIIQPERMKGIITIYDGEKLLQYNPHTNGKKIAELMPNEFRNQMFLGTFIHNYLQSENVTIAVQKIEGEGMTVLEAIIPGGSNYMATQKLWIDQQTYQPHGMSIYDSDGKEVVKMKFLKFIYNPEIKEEMFLIQ